MPDRRSCERRYRAVDPENRLVARGLEAEWEAALQAAQDAEAELDRRETAQPVRLSTGERAKILAIATDLPALWAASSTTDRDRKELLHALLDDIRPVPRQLPAVRRPWRFRILGN